MRSNSLLLMCCLIGVCAVTGMNQAAPVTFFAGKDTTLLEESPTTNSGGSTSLLVGNNGASTKKVRAYLWFDISSIPASATVTAATLTLRSTLRSPVGAASISLDVWRSATSPSEMSANWANDSATTGPSAYASAVTPTTGNNIQFDVYNLVEAWRAGFTNNGIIIRAANEAGTSYFGYSSDEGSVRPELTVTWNALPIIASPSVSTDGTNIWVYFTADDPENSTMRFTTQLWNSAHTAQIGTTLESIPLASIDGLLQQLPYDLSSRGLTAGANYAVRIELFDSNAASPSAVAWVNFTYPGPLAASISSISSSPTSGGPGDAVSWTYNVTASQAMNVLFGATLRSGTTNYDLTPVGGVFQTLNAGSGSYPINRSIPAGLAPGAYSIRGSIYRDTNGNNTIDVGTDQELSAAANYGTFTVTEPNTLGLDVSALSGKKVRGPIFLGAPSNTASLYPWTWFYIKSGTTTLAETYVGGATGLVLNDAPWRKPDGTYVAQWSDIVSGTTTLTVVGEDSLGQQFSSSAFTVTPQTALTVTLSPPANTFPTFNFPITPTFTGLGTGGTGSPQYSWYYRSTSPLSTTASFSPTFSVQGAHVVTLKVTDTNNNVTFAQYVAPVAYRLTVGNPAMNGGGSTLVGPVDVVSGNMHISLADHAVPSFGVPFMLTRAYNSQPTNSTRFWRFNVEEYAISGVFTVSGTTFAGRSLFIYRADGTKQEYYIDESGNYVPLNPGSFDILVETGSGPTATLTLYEQDGTERTFNRSPIIVTGNNASIWMLTSVKSPRGQGLTITHTGTASNWLFLPRIQNVTDAAGRVITFTYDAGGHISRVDDPTGLYVTYTWDANHNITASRDLRGKITNYIYRVGSPGDKRLIAITRPRGNTPLNNVVYDGSGRVTSFSDGDNFTTSFDYSDPNATIVTPPVAAEKLKFVLDPSTRAITSVIEAFGSGNFTTTLTNRTASANNRIADYSLLSNTQDTAGRNTSLTYLNNTRGQIQTTTEPGSRTTTYAWQDVNAARNISTVSNVSTPEGRSYGSTPNAYGEITGTTDPASNASSTIYNSKGLPSSTTDALNRTTSFIYDTYGNLTSMTDHTGATATIEYLEPRNGRPTRRTDRRGYHTDYAYDDAGNLLTETNHIGGQIVNTYDDNGNLATTRDRRGNYATLAYNNRDLTQSVTRTAPVNGTSMMMSEMMGYDGMGRVQSIKNGRGNTTYSNYNSRGLLSSIVNGEGETVLTLTYNVDGTVNTQTKGSGAAASTISFGYDTLGRQTSVTDGLGNQVQMTYNNDNQVTGQRDARGNWTYFTYDTAARLATVTDTGNAVTRAFYDAIGRLTEVRDPLNHSTFYTFDDPNRRITERDHLSRSWINTHDAEGNLITEAFPDGRTFTYTYDALGRLDYLNYTGGRFADPSYDADGNIISLADHLGITSYEYDSLSRMCSMTDPYGQTVTYLCDAASNITRITYPGSGKVVNYTFDNAERMKTVAPWAGGVFTYNWRSDGLPSRITNGNTTYTDYGYDAAARLTSLVTRYSSGTAFITQNLTLDGNNNITRILGDQPTAPPADAPKTMTYDATNRLLTDDVSSVSHDTAGRLGGNPASTGGTATWEGRDWLATYTPTGGSTSGYNYNGLGQRLSRTQGGNTTRYVLDVNQALPAVLMENNASNVAQRYYIHGLGLLASIDTTNNVITYHFNHRGDTLALTNASQTITESYGCSPHGVTAASIGVSGNPFRFIGQAGVMDEGNGLHFMRARYFERGTDRFLSKDVITGTAGKPESLNRYAYAAGNPIINIDPTGLSGESPLWTYTKWVVAKGAFESVCILPDKSALKLAAFFMPGNGLAQDFLARYLQGTGGTQKVSISKALAGDSSLNSKITAQLRSVLAKPQSTPSGSIKIEQADFGNRDLKLAIGGFNLNWRIVTQDVKTRTAKIELSFKDTYKWHPEKNSLADKCIHQSAENLKSTAGAKEFLMVGEATTITIRY